jgi:cell division protein FtsB
VKPEAGKAEFPIRRKLFIAGVAFFLLVILVTSFFGKKGYMDIARSRKAYRALETECRKLEEQKLKIELEIAELEANPKAVEKEAREKLWLMKPDEKAIVIKGRKDG